jgi:hypothetical protein
MAEIARLLNGHVRDPQNARQKRGRGAPLGLARPLQ